MADRTVLVVEDDPALQQVYADVLRDQGWRVHVAGDGVEALDILQDGLRPCVAVVDLRMPRMDGWTLIRELRKGPWHELPFVILAAHYQVHEEAKRIGARWWLQKPVGIDRLLDVINEACAAKPPAT